jgi:hypothetical protein
MIKNAEARLVEIFFIRILRHESFSTYGLNETRGFLTQTPTIVVLPTPESEGDFSFRHTDMSELLSTINWFTSNVFFRSVRY